MVRKKARRAALHAPALPASSGLYTLLQAQKLVLAPLPPYSCFSSSSLRYVAPHSPSPSSAHTDSHAIPDQHSYSLFSTTDQPSRPSRPSSFARLLQLCADSTDLFNGRLLHESTIIAALDHIPFLQCQVLQLYSQCAAMDDALKIFVSMNEKDLVTWNIIIENLAKQGHENDVFCHYVRMHQEAFLPSRTTCMVLFSVISGPDGLKEAQKTHVLVLEIVGDMDVVLGTALVNAYGKCGSIEESKAAFTSLPLANVVTWTTMISICAQHHHGHDALEFFEKMVQEDVCPDRVTFINVLAACSSQSMLSEGHKIHTWVFCLGFEQDISIGNALINLYNKCRMLIEAHTVFNSMQVRDVVSWSSVVSLYARHERFSEALSTLHQMEVAGCSPNKVTFVTALALLTCQEALTAGCYIHNCIIKKGLDGDVIVQNALINMYDRCSCPESARRTFDTMSIRNIISWTSIIGVHTHQGQSKEVFAAFDDMQTEGLIPNRVTFTNMIELCSNQRAQSEGRLLHACIMDTNHRSDLVIQTALVKMHGFCSGIEDAQKVFNQIAMRDLVAWNTIIAVYADHDQSNNIFQLFILMLGEGILPDDATYGLLFAACAKKERLDHGTEVHARAHAVGLEMNVVTATNIINMYSKCGAPLNSRRLFDRMSNRNVISWTTMVCAYTENGLHKSALQLFAQMIQECVLPNMVTLISILTVCSNELEVNEGKRLHVLILYTNCKDETALGNALINMYGRYRSLRHVQETFDHMSERNVVSWSGMIAAYAQHGNGFTTLQHFEQMKLNAILPNDVTLVSMLDACASQTCLVGGEMIHTSFINETNDISVLGNSLINMYNKCGSLRKARKLFVRMMERDMATWNVMIGAYAEHGEGKEAFELLQQMLQEGYTTDEATTVNFLSSCSHSGEFSDALLCFVFLVQHYYLTPSHCACLIDLFGRAGLVEMAHFFINHVPIQPTVMSFMSLLGACRYQGDVARGEHASRHIMELNAKSTAPFYMLKHIYLVDYDDTICTARPSLSMLDDALYI